MSRTLGLGLQRGGDYPRRLPQALLGVKPDADEAQGL